MTSLTIINCYGGFCPCIAGVEGPYIILRVIDYFFLNQTSSQGDVLSFLVRLSKSSALTVGWSIVSFPCSIGRSWRSLQLECPAAGPLADGKVPPWFLHIFVKYVSEPYAYACVAKGVPRVQ